ncbi:PRC-barrel domain-containing protein [Tabrizicola soli]|uniref:PRC-barrel domain-containing protein n=1 Tax=Tabrizicola soli TaxID=2185115 RepID=A0ABV7DU66_9RHOB|nr:PRC-barrel domain-containing protein [Tabrizicola soli]
MRRLTLTTALVAAFLPAAAFAQTADPAAPQVEVTVPEGFEPQEAMLSAEELLGEKVYDVTGESIGEVGDLVFTMTDTEGTEAPTATGNGTADATTTPTTGDTATDGTTAAPATGDAATTTVPEAADGTATDATAPAADDATATDTTTAPATDDATATDGTTAPATDGSTAMDTTTATGDATAPDDTATATDDGTATPDTGTADTTAADSGTADDTAYTAPAPSDSAADTATTAGDTTTATAATVGEVTHVVLDIGGFLGIGEHRVAVPVSDLAFYRNGDDTRVYLPWSREQLEAVPAYNADDPATWATSTLPAGN